MSAGRKYEGSAVALTGVLGAIAVIATVLLLAPTVIVIVLSFTNGFSLKFPPPGYSLRWYASLPDAFQLQYAALNSLKVACASTLLAVVLGVGAAMAIARSEKAMARVLDSFFMSPLILPALAFGLASLIYFSRIGIQLSLWTLVIGHTVVGVPYVIRTTVAALSQLPPALLESSASLGASRAYTFRRVTLPLIAPGVAAGAFICFMSSFDNVPVSLFLRDASTDMLPIRMWQDLEGRLDVSIAAVSTLMVLVTLVLMVVMERLAGISKRIR
ncbi:ABC transporter permease [Variovorax arabinosiphilus]|uniref:ABC transporter permease n=1 Tax=Variovorax arabinosiphilus TaxID=3053498 RepID=UPI002578160B|nr:MULTISPECIES: ABC transporter permease [unclassified Variovorax]MDM0123017.1 ABC transporter permease [Variovorax sp. J2L1-78]MDM0131987.1 ABC transporter permease [Variovorax sp. J2L1-63]MDM0235780.1 ABC transporter permease [Variovorax sp. J2R1-6]